MLFSDFPQTLSGFQSGTWLMRGNTICHNGEPIVDDYGQDFFPLKVGYPVSELQGSVIGLSTMTNVRSGT